LATLGALLILGACAAYAFSTDASTAPTYTTTVYRTTTGQIPTVSTTSTTDSSDSTTTSTTSSTTSVSTTTLISVTVQTITETPNSTSSTTTTSTSSAPITNSTSATNSTTSSSSSQVSLEVQVSYAVYNDTSCQSYQSTSCTYSGEISWPGPNCNYLYSCQSIVISPQTESVTYPVTLDECGISVQWSISMTTPPNESQLTLTVMDSGGAVLYQSSSTPYSSALSGSYQPC